MLTQMACKAGFKRSTNCAKNERNDNISRAAVLLTEQLHESQKDYNTTSSDEAAASFISYQDGGTRSRSLWTFRVTDTLSCPTFLSHLCLYTAFRFLPVYI